MKNWTRRDGAIGHSLEFGSFGSIGWCIAEQRPWAWFNLWEVDRCLHRRSSQ